MIHFMSVMNSNSLPTILHCSKYLKERTLFSNIHNGTHAGFKVSLSSSYIIREFPILVNIFC